MSIWDGAFQWITHVINAVKTGGSSYIAPTDNDEDDDDVIQYKTVISYSEPLRTTKCLFVSEMPDFFTDAELNSGYHTKAEYEESIRKYGFIYKSQKFSNASTAQKLLDYATDWVKNNYHGGLTSFTITALDMRLAGYTDMQKFTIGRRVRVKYPDPVTKQKTEKVLTLISAEYDLYNPEKNQYKIGIPDITLNKVYGETSKSGSGGSSGGNTSSDNDTEDGTTMDGLTDAVDGAARDMDETTWAHIYKIVTGTDDPETPSSYNSSQLQTPSEKDPGTDFVYTLVSDYMKTGDLKGTIGEFTTKLKSKYIVSSGAVDAKTLNADASNVTEAKSTNSTVKETLTVKDGIFDSMEIDGKTVKFAVENKKPVIWINGTKFKLETDSGTDDNI